MPFVSFFNGFNFGIIKLELQLIHAGEVIFDGGAIFGPVPKTKWETLTPVDANNLVPLRTNCVLGCLGNAGTIIVDAGERNLVSPNSANNLSNHLASAGVSNSEVTHVFLTHLHSDHVGGCLLNNNQARFPNSKLVVQKIEWLDATSRNRALKGAYDQELLSKLDELYSFHFVDGEESFGDQVVVQRSGGHTRGHQIVNLLNGEFKIVFVGDTIPTRHHINPNWTMAYDQFPMQLKKFKWNMLDHWASQKAILILSHEVEFPVGRVGIEDGRFVWKPETDFEELFKRNFN